MASRGLLLTYIAVDVLGVIMNVIILHSTYIHIFIPKIGKRES